MPRVKKDPTEAQLAARAAGAERFRAAAETRKNVPPVAPIHYLESEEQEIGQGKTRTLRSEGPAIEALDPPGIVVSEFPVNKEKLEMLKFMEDELLVVVHDSTSPTDEKFPEVWNDGRKFTFIRGKEMRVKRKFVEILARAKRTVYSQEQQNDRSNYDNIPHTGLRYPFAVANDPDPRGKEWLRGILQES